MNLRQRKAKLAAAGVLVAVGEHADDPDRGSQKEGPAIAGSLPAPAPGSRSRSRPTSRTEPPPSMSKAPSQSTGRTEPGSCPPRDGYPTHARSAS
jgi:hypothetical protein